MKPILLTTLLIACSQTLHAAPVKESRLQKPDKDQQRKFDRANEDGVGSVSGILGRDRFGYFEGEAPAGDFQCHKILSIAERYPPMVQYEKLSADCNHFDKHDDLSSYEPKTASDIPPQRTEHEEVEQKRTTEKKSRWSGWLGLFNKRKH